MHHSCLQKTTVVVTAVEELIAFHRMILAIRERVVVVVAAEEQRHRVTRLIVSSLVAIELLGQVLHLLVVPLYLKYTSLDPRPLPRSSTLR